MHLPLWPIFRQSHPNFINIRAAYASEIWAQLTKNLLTKSGTERLRANIFSHKYINPIYIPALSFQLKRPSIQLIILSFLLDQLIMAAALDDVALFQYHDHIGVTHCG